MANSFYTPTQVAQTAVAMAQQGAYLSGTINRNYENDLLGGGGKSTTVNIKVPSALVARERGIDDITTAIILDSLSETTIPLTLGTHVYSGVALSEGDLTLHLASFAEQVLQPQMDAVVDDIEDLVSSAINAAPGLQTGEKVRPSVGSNLKAAWASDPIKFLIDVRRILVARGVPQSNLNVVVGTNVYADLVSTGKLLDAAQAASSAALREGSVGRVAGFTIVESTRVNADHIVAYHRDAFTLATRAPLVPAGVAFGAFEASGGYSLRYIRDYDASVAKDRSLVSTFAGAAAMPLYKITRTYNHTTPASSTATVTTVPGGAALQIDTSDSTAVS